MNSLPELASLAALLVAGIALWRALVPPQTRYVLELTAEVHELQTALLGLAGKVTKRERTETVAGARTVVERNRARDANIAAEAAAVLAAARPQGDLLPHGGGDVEQTRNALRAKLGMVPGVRTRQ